MSSREHINVNVLDESGAVRGVVNIALLPRFKANNTSDLPLIYLADQAETESMPPVQLLESIEYRYEFIEPTDNVDTIRTDHAEIFQADTQQGRSGRIKPGLYTGTLPINVELNGEKLGAFSLEVRSKKLSYLKEYRWMVRDLAEHMSEVVMNRFAPAMQRFRPDDTRDAQTLYQRFAFLKSLISGEDFQAAISEIIRRPHVSWEDIHETTHPGKGLKAGSYVARQLAKAGPRQAWKQGVINSIPHQLERRRTEVTVDTTPNRFVKFAIERWRDVVSRIETILESQSANPSVDRGLREVRDTLNYLDAVLAEGLFRELGKLDSFPADNQVLHKREGYRDIFRAYIQFDVAAMLSWEGGEDVYGAGKKDVATLYEYWVFMKLADLVSELCDTPFNFSKLIKGDDDSLNLVLKTGRTRVLRSTVERQGRLLDVVLWFNRTFSNKNNHKGSWSKQMRPDYSLRISPAKSELACFEPVYVHFDAKYRIEKIEELFELDGDEAEENVNERPNKTNSAAKRYDLLKMHAYRDAIHRSAGAYVLYPGNKEQVFREYHELLPGLGAFALRPTEYGDAAGKLPLKRFIEDILEHVSSQVTQHERGRYWIRESFDPNSYVSSKLPAASFLSAPPADSRVLLGYVKDNDHWQWIENNKLYNIRAYGHRGTVQFGAKELDSELILLSNRASNRSILAKVVGNPVIHSKEQMQQSGYLSPKGNYYCFCLEFTKDDPWLDVCDGKMIEDIRYTLTHNKAPVVLSWLDLVRNIELITKNRP